MRTGEAPPCLLSIHDVMPGTLPRVERILERLQALDRAPVPVALLVVPGRDWEPGQLDRLREWAEAGLELAAHGWTHRVDRFGGLFHRLHGAVLSRRVAEHLALDAPGIVGLMQASKAWFAGHGLPSPGLYVPPAWALGRLDQASRQQLPFDAIEVTRGLLDPVSGAVRFLPLVGFEADNAWRAAFLRQWNRFAVRRARRRREVLRISLHPDDLELRLRDQLEDLLRMPWSFRRYQDEGAKPKRRVRPARER